MKQEPSEASMRNCHGAVGIHAINGVEDVNKGREQGDLSAQRTRRVAQDHWHGQQRANFLAPSCQLMMLDGLPEPEHQFAAFGRLTYFS